MTVALVGAGTALFAATVACAQDDIKRVLAYSTISQLGYMVMATGAGAYVAGLFHMVTHAFFKALLFLCAGSVIHGMHDEQDMKRMGALRRYLPVTFATFVVGWLAISGIPPLAGFWSKDDILSSVWAYHGQLGHLLWAVGFVTAGLTAYYMSRQVALVFFGKERWRRPAEAAAAHGPAGATPHDSAVATDESGATPESAGAAPGSAGAAHESGTPHESPWVMLVPLVALALLALVGGLLNLPLKPLDLLDK